MRTTSSEGIFPNSKQTEQVGIEKDTLNGEVVNLTSGTDK